MYTSATHNAIMEVGGKDRALMLVAGSYAPIRIKGKEIDTAPSLPLELETKDVNNEEDTLRDKEIDKLVALI
ncbi:hypothetical protein Tco_0451941 [Tanacetum coccineum]